MRGRVLVAFAVLGCGNPSEHADGGIDSLGDALSDGSDAFPDAPPLTGYRVGGVAFGMRGPVVLRLDAAGHRQVVVSQDGPFWFPGRVDGGTPYAASTANTTCNVLAPSGTVGTTEVSSIELDCRGVVELASATFASGTPSVPFTSQLTPAFDPGALVYTGTRPFFMDETDSIAVTPIASYPGRPSITVYNDATISGSASPPHVLGTGPTVTLAHPNSLTQTYTFTLVPGRPSQTTYVKASNAAAGDRFSTVAISGNTLVVGAPSQGGTGAIYVFVRSGTTWTQQAGPLKPSSLVGAGVGAAVAIDGDVLVAGAPATGADLGAAFVYRRSGTTWSLDATLTAATAQASDRFGYSVGVSGTSIVVGCPFENGSGTAPDRGGVYFFRYTTSWGADGHVLGTADNDHLGWSVGVSATTAIVGAPDVESGATLDAGAAFIFVRGGAGWAAQGSTLRAPGPTASGGFGTSVAVDGDTAAIAEPKSPGAAYVFQRTGSAWAFDGSPIAGPGANSEFASSIAIDRAHLIVGARLEDSSTFGVDPIPNTAGVNSGAAYVYRRTPTGWDASHFVKASNTTGLGGASAGDKFGTSVAVDGEWFVVGAPDESSDAMMIDGTQTNENSLSSGAAYVFR